MEKRTPSQTRVLYFLPDDGDVEECPNSFLIQLKPTEKTLTLGVLRKRFPLPGVYHFRVKRTYLGNEIWEDLVDDSQTVSTSSEVVTLKISRIRLLSKPQSSSASKRSSQQVTSRTHVSRSPPPLLTIDTSKTIGGQIASTCSSEAITPSLSSVLQSSQQQLPTTSRASTDLLAFDVSQFDEQISAASTPVKTTKLVNPTKRRESVGGDNIDLLDGLDWGIRDLDFDSDLSSTAHSSPNISSTRVEADSNLDIDFSPFGSPEVVKKEVRKKLPTTNVAEGEAWSKLMSGKSHSISLKSIANDFEIY